MRSSDSHFGLGFLLSLGALPLSACSGGDDDDDTAATTPTLGTAPTAEGDGTGADDGTGATNPTDPSAGTDPTAGTNPTATDPSDTGVSTDPTDPTGLDSGTGGLPEACIGLPISPGCQAWADKYAECYPRYAGGDYAAACACYLMYYEMYGAGCVQAFEDWYACIGMQSCDIIMGKTGYCETEEAALGPACDFGDTTGGSGSSGG